MPRHSIWIRVCLILLVVSAAADGASLHIINLYNRPANQILPVIRPLVEPGGSISGRGFRLFVSTSQRNFADIRHVVTELDVPEKMLRISVRQSRGLDRTDSMRTMSGGLQSGNTHITVSGEGPTLPGTTSSAGSYRIERHTSRRIGFTTRFVSVLDGHRAFIQVGRSYPQVQPFVALANGQIDIGAGIEYHDVATGFEVLPRLHGDKVWIEVTPRFSFASNRGSQAVDFQRLRTTIDARIGQWVDLGGVVGANSDITRTILGRTNVTAATPRRILIRIDRTQ